MKFCNTEFWSTPDIWDTPNPDFTPCFEKSMLISIPCIYLWLFSPWHFMRLRNSKDKFIPWSWINVSKIVISLLQLVITICLLIANIVYGRKDWTILINGVDYYYPSVLIATLCLQLVIVYVEKTRGFQTSGFLFGFWFLSAICDAPGYRSIILLWQDYNESDNDLPEPIWAIFVFYMMFYPLVVIMFFVFCFADKPPLQQFIPRGPNCSPLLNASFLSQITFTWHGGLIWKAFRKPLKQEDLWDLPPSNLSQSVVRRWDKNFKITYQRYERKQKQNVKSDENMKSKIEEPREKKKPFSLLPVILRTFRYQLITGLILKLIPDLLVFVSPQIINVVIEFIQVDEIYEWKGYFYCAILLVVTELQSVLNGQQFRIMYQTGLQIRSAVTSAVYRKSLRISSSSKKESTVGEIVNLMAVDVQRFLDLIGWINSMWTAPIQIGLCVYFLWNTLGPSALVGLFVMLVLIPLNGIIVNFQKVFQIAQMKEKDKRVRLISEILNGIKVLKLYAWEPSFINQVQDIRKREVNVLKKNAYLGAATSFLFTCTPFMVSFFMFLTYVLVSDENVLTADVVFVSISLMNILRMPMTLLPIIIVSMVQASVSLNRLNSFMSSDELDPNAVERDKNETDPVVVENGTFSWGPDVNDRAILKKINIRVAEGSLVGIVGTVGSGKSSLCHAILGEMDKDAGRVNVNKTLAYVPQQAWMQNATMKDNILFGKERNDAYYEKVIDACALRPDLAILSDGDQTEIGEKGINLSGGQKQRISLARAVYSQTEVYLMDDPLSAVDAHVGKHIFEHVIGPQGILRNKTRILVTHGLGYLHCMDEIFVMKNGEIVERGSLSTLIRKKGNFREFLLQYLNDGSETDQDLEAEALEELKSEIEKTGDKVLQRGFSQMSKRSQDSKRARTGTSTSMVSMIRRESQLSKISHVSHTKKVLQGEETFIPKGKLIQEESAEVGKISYGVYLYYAKSIGLVSSVFTIIFYFISQMSSVFANVLLSDWSEDLSGNDPKTRNKYLAIYASFGIGQALFILLGYSILAKAAIFGARALHNSMLNNILRSPMSFFDMTPIGRIVNRFSKDVDMIDVLLPMNMRSILMCLMTAITTFGAIIYATPIFTAVLIPAVIVYVVIQKIYVNTTRQLKRIESVTRSPIYTHFGESIQGAVTIRAYNKQDDFILQSEEKVDYNQLSYFPSICSYRWLGIRLEFIGNLLTFFAALFAVLNRGHISGGDVGLSISYALSVTGVLNFLVRLTADVESNIVSVERIKEYTETPQEAQWIIPDSRPQKTWPDKGVIDFVFYSTRYRKSLDLVVKNINFHVNPTEKVGIVGRTGAGKSSLTLALFRIIEPAHGTILIDDVDITKIGLHDLRGKLTIIPQDPVLFSGTLRMNLDPFEKYEDRVVWDALEQSHLKEFVSNLTTKLNYEISEGGENLSVGQRQLVCLARALLRKTKVLILDEATAAIDMETDDLIQDTIRRVFADCTVITIAHRLNTIMDSTRIIVLDKGEIKEFDSPANLLNDHMSMFYDMAKSAGLV